MLCDASIRYTSSIWCILLSSYLKGSTPPNGRVRSVWQVARLAAERDDFEDEEDVEGIASLVNSYEYVVTLNGIVVLISRPLGSGYRQCLLGWRC